MATEHVNVPSAGIVAVVDEAGRVGEEGEEMIAEISTGMVVGAGEMTGESMIVVVEAVTVGTPTGMGLSRLLNAAMIDILDWHLDGDAHETR